MIWMIFSALKTTEEVFGSYGVVVFVGSPVGKFLAGFRRSTVFTLYREQFFYGNRHHACPVISIQFACLCPQPYEVQGKRNTVLDRFEYIHVTCSSHVRPQMPHRRTDGAHGFACRYYCFQSGQCFYDFFIATKLSESSEIVDRCDPC